MPTMLYNIELGMKNNKRSIGDDGIELALALNWQERWMDKVDKGKAGRITNGIVDLGVYLWFLLGKQQLRTIYKITARTR